MSTLAVRIEPSIVWVSDADGATLQVVLDNRMGLSGVRVFLGGSDPERAIRFTFSPPVVDLGPGQVGTVLCGWTPGVRHRGRSGVISSPSPPVTVTRLWRPGGHWCRHRHAQRWSYSQSTSSQACCGCRPGAEVSCEQ
jgi:hypothetical protein